MANGDRAEGYKKIGDWLDRRYKENLAIKSPEQEKSEKAGGRKVMHAPDGKSYITQWIDGEQVITPLSQEIKDLGLSPEKYEQPFTGEDEKSYIKEKLSQYMGKFWEDEELDPTEKRRIGEVLPLLKSLGVNPKGLHPNKGWEAELLSDSDKKTKTKKTYDTTAAKIIDILEGKIDPSTRRKLLTQDVRRIEDYHDLVKDMSEEGEYLRVVERSPDGTFQMSQNTIDQMERFKKDGEDPESAPMYKKFKELEESYYLQNLEESLKRLEGYGFGVDMSQPKSNIDEQMKNTVDTIINLGKTGI
jgi:hypothetical protein